MDIQDLQSFVAIAESGSITAASGRLHRAPSGISVRLKQLEATLGQPLFDRIGKGLVLNPAGERFLGAARDLIQRAQHAEQMLRSKEPAGRLRLASMESTAASHLPPILEAFHGQNPQVQLSLRTLPSWHAVDAVLSGELDAAFVSADAFSRELHYQPAFREKLVLVTHKGHSPLTHPKQAAGETLLTFASGCAYRDRLDRWLQQQPHNPRNRLEIGSYHAMLSCVVAGMGIALAPEAVIQHFAGRKALRKHTLPARLRDDTTCLISHPARQSASLDALAALLPAIKN